jgi:hypothetical protein
VGEVSRCAGLKRDPVPKLQANLRTTLFTANFQKNLTAKAPICRSQNIEGVSAVMQHGAAPVKAALGYQLRRRSTEGTEGLYRQPRLLPPIRLFCQPSQKAAFKTAGKANRLSNQRASILIRLSGLLTAFAVNSLSLCQLTELSQIQMSFGTDSRDNGKCNGNCSGGGSLPLHCSPAAFARKKFIGAKFRQIFLKMKKMDYVLGVDAGQKSMINNGGGGTPQLRIAGPFTFRRPQHTGTLRRQGRSGGLSP